MRDKPGTARYLCMHDTTEDVQPFDMKETQARKESAEHVPNAAGSSIVRFKMNIV